MRIAQRRLIWLEHRLSSDQRLRQQYVDFIKDY